MMDNKTKKILKLHENDPYVPSIEEEKEFINTIKQIMKEADLARILLKVVQDCDVYSTFDGESIEICGNPTLTSEEKALLSNFIGNNENDA